MRHALSLAGLAAALSASLAACTPAASHRPTASTTPIAYPPAPRGTDVDTFHGNKVPDPYRWLEKADSPQSEAWVAAENKLTRSFIDGPVRNEIKSELKRIWDYPKVTEPNRVGTRYFFERNTGLQNQNVVFRLDRLGSPPQLVIDPNTLSADGTISLETQAYSFDGHLLAYGLSASGSDRQEIHVRNVDTGQDLPDLLRFTKFTGIGWKHDNSGFFYNRFPAPGTVPPEDENNFCKIYYHQLGTLQSADTLLLERPDDKTLQMFPSVSDDGQFLIVSINKGTAPENRLWFLPLNQPNPTPAPAQAPANFIKLLDTPDASYSFIDNVGSTFYILTNLNAPRSKIIAIDLAHPERAAWKTILPEGPDALASVSTVNNQFVVTTLHDAWNQVKLFNLDGSFDRDIPVPAFGSVNVSSTRRDYTDIFLGYTSYARPYTVYRYDFPTHQLSTYHASEIKTDLSPFETRQAFATSKDGTRIPLFIACRKDLKLDGNNPALLTAYGGFDVNTTPGFDIPIALWLRHGGIYVTAIIRGGGEYGEAWHQAGMLTHKQNGFDDFQAAAEFLIHNRYTTQKRLAIDGASNGGLLTAACMLQRPDLYGAVLSQVPVIDMLRYKKFAAGTGWIPEYGDAEGSPEMFKTLLAYSPLHNVKPGVVYPPLLVTTADSDDRVDPSHAKKFVATLQTAQQSLPPGTPRNPLLLRVDTKAGHGGGKPTDKIIDEEADLYAFLFRTLHMK